MDIAKMNLPKVMGLLKEFGTVIPMREKLNTHWVMNYNMVVTENNNCAEAINAISDKIVPPQSFQDDFIPLKEKYAQRTEGIEKKIEEKKQLIEAVIDISEGIRLKKELEELEKNIFVPAMDSNGKVNKWSFHAKDQSEETTKALNDFNEKYKDYYSIVSSEKLPEFDESWDDETKEYYNSLKANLEERMAFLRQIVNIDFMRLPISFIPDFYPPMYNHYFDVGSPIMQIFFIPPSKEVLNGNGQFKGNKGKLKNVKHG